MSVFLEFTDNAEEEYEMELLRYAEVSTFFLPDQYDGEDALIVNREPSETHSILRLDIYGEYACISVHADSNPKTELLFDEKVLVMPLSSESHRISIMLRDEDHFCTPAGLWSLRWELSSASAASSSSNNHNRMDVHATLAESDPISPNTEHDRIENPAEPIMNGHNVNTSDYWYAYLYDSTERDIPSIPGPIMHDSEFIPAMLPTQEIHLSSPVTAKGNDQYESQHSLQTNNDTEPETLSSQHDNINMLGRDAKMEQNKLSRLTRLRKRRTAEIESGSALDQNVKTQKDREGESRNCAPRTQNAENRSQEHSDAHVAIEVSASVNQQAVQMLDNMTSGGRVHIKAACSREEKQQPVTRTRQAPMKNFSLRSARSSGTTSGRSISGDRLRSVPHPIIVFSTTTSAVHRHANLMTSYERLGGRIVSNVHEANMFCVGNNSLKKTAKFILAVALSKDIVTDKWLEDAHTTGKFPGVDAYLPKDAEKEDEWQFTLRDAIARGKRKLTLLNGFEVILTPKVQKELADRKADFKKIAIALGANRVSMSIPQTITAQTKMVVIGSIGEESQGRQMGNVQTKLYNKDLLSMAALRGVLELESDEFVISGTG